MNRCIVESLNRINPEKDSIIKGLGKEKENLLESLKGFNNNDNN